MPRVKKAPPAAAATADGPGDRPRFSPDRHLDRVIYTLSSDVGDEHGGPVAYDTLDEPVALATKVALQHPGVAVKVRVAVHYAAGFVRHVVVFEARAVRIDPTSRAILQEHHHEELPL
jgi:hypothetical protein